MEEKCGTTQVEEDKSSATTEASQQPLGDLFAGESETIPKSVFMHAVCFLIREHAKSGVALVELQKRLQQIEGIQGDVITSVSEVRDYLSSGTDNDLQAYVLSRSCASNKSPHLKVPSANLSFPLLRSNRLHTKLSSTAHAPEQQDKKWHPYIKKPESNLHAQTLDPKFMGSIRVKDSAPESDKQDSGLDSDCREQGQESNPPPGEAAAGFYNVCSPAVNPNTSDELSDLLDEIGEKSEILRQHLSGLEESPSRSPLLTTEMGRLQLERLVLQNLLCDIKDERDDLKTKLDDLETTTGEIAAEKKDLEQRFISALVKKHKLETRMHSFKSFPNKSSSSSSSSSRSECGNTSYSNLAKKLVYKVDGEALSSVLKETNIVELQKQVLTYMMENEVLRMKLEQVGQVVSSKDLEKQCVESVFREEVKQLMYENEQLRMSYDEQKLEAEALASRVAMLERVLHSMTVENRELNLQLGESYLRNRLQNTKRIPGQSFSSSSGSSSAGLPKRIRLPTQENEQEISVRCAKSRVLPNTSSFIDVTIEDQDESERDLALTLEPFGLGQHRSSTPMQNKKHLKPTFSDLPGASTYGLAAKSNASALYSSERKPNKTLTFNSMKTLTSQSNLGLSGRDSYKNRILPTSNSCDRSPRRTADASVARPLESIQEGIPDSKKFPFYTILEKLKASSDYKPSSQLPQSDQQEDCFESNSHKRCSVSKGESSNPVPPRKSCGNIPSEKTQEENSTQTKEKRAVSKNIHKRIQDILDRITAESDTVSNV